MLKNIFKSKFFYIIVITIILITIMFSTVNPSSKLYFLQKPLGFIIIPTQNYLNIASSKIHNWFEFASQMKTFKYQNEILRNENNTLKSRIMQLENIKSENDRLRSLLDIKDKYKDNQLLTCQIIAKDPGNWFEVFTIDKGENDGIKPNMVVINNQGLVGRVMSTTDGSSKVMSIIDVASAISVRLTKTRDLLTVKGDINLKEQGSLKLNYITSDILVGIGDEIETSGIGGIYPRGLYIGRIKQIPTQNYDLVKYAIVEPSVDFKRLEEVFVIIK